MYYVYIHRRKDNNNVIYVGCSKQSTPEQLRIRGNTFQGLHFRAFEKTHSRTDKWKEIYNSVGISVEVVFYSNNREEVLNKEIELIELYKETVINITKGGLGVKGLIHTEENKAKISNKLKGVKKSQAHADKINRAKLKPVKMIISDSEFKIFSSAKEASEYLGFPESYSNIGKCAKGIRNKALGYKWEYINEIKENTG